MKEKGGHDGYQAYVEKLAEMASFINYVKRFFYNKDI
jgi:hypothetical protein